MRQFAADERSRRQPFELRRLYAPPRAPPRRRPDRRSGCSCTTWRPAPGLCPRPPLPDVPRPPRHFRLGQLLVRGLVPAHAYSLLYYLPTALVGNLPLVFVSAVASTVLFSSIAWREWGRAALWPSRVFGVLAAAPMFTGLYAYSLGFTAMLATLKLLQLRRPPRDSRSAYRGLQPARVRVPLPDRRRVRDLAAPDRAASRLVRGRPRRRRGDRGARARAFPGRPALPVPLDRLRRRARRQHARRPRRPECARCRAARRRSSRCGGSAAWSSTSSRRRSGTTGHGSAPSCSRSCSSPRASPASARAASSSSRSRALAYNLVPYGCSSLTARQPDAEGELLEARDPFPPRARPAGLPRRGRTDSGALGGVLDPEEPASRSRAGGTASSTWPTTQPCTGKPRRHAYRSWLRSNAVRYVLLSTTTPLDGDGGRRRSASCKGRAPGCRSSSTAGTGRSTSCHMRCRCSPARRTRS